MAMMTTSSPADLITQFQTKYSKDLLPRAEQLITLDQFAFKSPFPKNGGATTMRMFRQKAVTDSTGVAEATEGVPPNTYTELELEYVEATIKNFEIVYKMSSKLALFELFNTMLMAKDDIAQKMALHADSIVRDLIAKPSTGVTTNKFYGSGVADWATLAAGGAGDGVMTIQDLLRAMTALELQRAPKKDGEYFAVVSPQVAYDLMLDTKFFIPVNTYQDKTNIVKGEVGKWFNVRVIKTTVPFREATGGAEGTFSSAGGIFTTIVLGSGGFGTPTLAGYSPYTPKLYIHDKAEKSDPTNKYRLVAAESWWASLVFQEKWMATIRSRTTYA